MAGSFACKSNAGVAPQEQLLGTMAGNRRLSIGLPAEHNGGEKRFPLTPEGVALLTKEGYRVFVESGAGEGIKYSDLHYTEAGAQATTASEVFRCDVVLKITPLNEQEAAMIRPGVFLLTLLQPQYQSASEFRTVRRRTRYHTWNRPIHQPDLLLRTDEPVLPVWMNIPYESYVRK